MYHSITATIIYIIVGRVHCQITSAKMVCSSWQPRLSWKCFSTNSVLREINKMVHAKLLLHWGKNCLSTFQQSFMLTDFVNTWHQCWNTVCLYRYDNPVWPNWSNKKVATTKWSYLTECCWRPVGVDRKNLISINCKVVVCGWPLSRYESMRITAVA